MSAQLELAFVPAGYVKVCTYSLGFEVASDCAATPQLPIAFFPEEVAITRLF